MPTADYQTLLDLVRDIFPAVQPCEPLSAPALAWDSYAAPLDENSALTPALESRLVVQLPLSGYTLTPLRSGEEEHEDIARVMNHPMVYPTLRSPPVPYTKDHAMVWSTLARRQQLAILVPLFSRLDSVVSQNCPGASPLGAIRYQDRLIGTVVLRGRVKDTAFAETTWEIGYSLHPDHAGKGVMYAALQAHLDFVRAVRKALEAPGRLPATTYTPRPLFFGAAMEHNYASQRVMQKAGLKIVRRVKGDGSTYGSRGSEQLAAGQQPAIGILPPHVVGQEVWDVELESVE